MDDMSQMTVERGLTSQEAARRLAEHGTNTVPVEQARGVMRRAGRQLSDPMLLLLMAAACLTTWQRDLADTAVIGLVIVVNTAVGVGQELRAERAIAALRGMAAPQAVVMRDGRLTTVPAAEVVPGDVIALESGDVIPADATVLEAHQLVVDESAVSGESVGVTKAANDGLQAGTTVTRGRVMAEVTDTGACSTLGRIAVLVASARPGPTPLQRRLTRLGRQLTVAAIVASSVVMTLGLLRGLSLTDAALTAASLAVAAVPESLPAVLTLSLALGARRMARQAAIARELRAVETLGSVTLLATDKTGTLTENRMVVNAVWTPHAAYDVAGTGYAPSGSVVPLGQPPEEANEELSALARDAALCNDADVAEHPHRPGVWRPLGDPTEAALVAFAGRAGLDVAAVRRDWPRLAEIPFDSARSWMLTEHSHHPAGSTGIAAERMVVVKGAPGVVLDACEPREPADRALAWARQQAAQGRRVLSVAEANGRAEPVADLPRPLRLIGVVAMTDPPRVGVGSVVDRLASAGIELVVMTGDAPTTAGAIAAQVGLVGRVVDASQVELDHEEAVVYARVRPEHKLSLVRRWQARGDVVAVTGDGVNDGPALRMADIGVAMGQGGTEVARQAADLVLTDDRLETVVRAVEEGRRIHDNLRRFLGYALSGGLAEVLYVLLAPFLGFPVPLLPGQILWINMLTHGLPGVALGAEPVAEGALTRPPVSPDAPVVDRRLATRILVTGLMIATVTTAAALIAHRTQADWQTAAFLVLGTAQLGVALALRDRGATRSNWFLSVTVVVALLLQGGAVTVPVLRALLETEVLPAETWAACLALAAVPGLLLKLRSHGRGLGVPRPHALSGWGPWTLTLLRRVADHEDMTTQLDLSAAVELARLAPSVHNTQPWRFRIDGETLILARDPERQLAVMDPTGRQQALSCGAALHLTRLALRLQGFDTVVDYLPRPSGTNDLARVSPVPGHRVSSEDVVLERAAHGRHTQRGPFDSRPLSRDVVAAIRGAAERHGAWLRWLDEPGDQVALTVLLARADAAERGDRDYLDELARWTARDEAAGDGLPLAATPDVRGRASNVRLRNFSGSEDPAHPTAGVGEPPQAERPVVVVLGTEGDEVADWLRAGEALMAMLLRGAVDGVQAQPLGQVIDLEWARARLAVDLGVVGCPQMVLRIGYGMPGADTPRRPVTDVLD